MLLSCEMGLLLKGSLYLFVVIYQVFVKYQMKLSELSNALQYCCVLVGWLVCKQVSTVGSQSSSCVSELMCAAVAVLVVI